MCFRSFVTSFLFPQLLTSEQMKGTSQSYWRKKNVEVIATDTDSRTIGNLYQYVKKNQVSNILALVVDVTNPTPALGFNNAERAAFHSRVKTDLVVALALIHHLAIGSNLTLELIAEYFSGIAPQLVIEFIPREDPKVQQMLASRRDVFRSYTSENFERYFEVYFHIRRKKQIAGTSRYLYLMQRK